MLNHPDLIVAQFKSHHEELVAEADHYRLLKLARQWRHATRADATDRKAAERAADVLVTTAPVAASAAAAFAGTLAKCGPHAAGSAR